MDLSFMHAASELDDKALDSLRLLTALDFCPRLGARVQMRPRLAESGRPRRVST